LSRSNYIDFPCPVCSSGNYTRVYRDTLDGRHPQFGYGFTPEHSKTYRIVRCNECGHAYSSPRPADLYEHYRDVVDADYLKDQGQRRRTAEKVIQRMKKYQPSGRLMDVGCSTADFLSVAKEHYTVEGLELSAWASDIARSRGFVVHNCTLEEFRARADYDIVTLWGVIEHVEVPKRAISSIHRILKNGGLVCLWTGNMDSITSKVMGKKWWWILGQHIQYFSERSLETLLTECGFERLYMGTYPYVMSMGSISKSLNRYPVLGEIAKKILNMPNIVNRQMTISLPGEMFAIYRKIPIS
jgi:ubiquinone/menaquinone biosynthesis C-methylase UbiE